MARTIHPPPTRFGKPNSRGIAQAKRVPPPLAPIRQAPSIIPARPAPAQAKLPGGRALQRAAPAPDFSGWIGPRDPGFAAFGVGMDQFKTATAESGKFILCTGGLGGCLGIAAYHARSKTAFLAHVQPDTLRAHMAEWVERVVDLGPGVTVHFASQAGDVDYISSYIDLLRGSGRTGAINAVQNSTSIAINAKDGAVLYGIDPRTLRMVT